MTIEKEISEIRPGSVIYIPSKLTHSVKYSGNQTLKSLFFFLHCDRWDQVKYVFID